MSVEFLDSDRVNFLIWRYLRESNYTETALKLQKEWRIGGIDAHDPALLPISQYVKHRALITLLHKGLVSEAFERELQQEEGHVPSQIGTFGPLPAPSKAPSPVTAFAAVAAAENNALTKVEPHGLKHRPEDDTLLLDNGEPQTLKRPPEWHGHHDQDESEASAKKARMSNGAATCDDDDDENAMDLDGDHEVDDGYPSPAERPSTPIITKGPEEGTQMDQVIELTGSTAFYSLSECCSRHNHHQQAQAENNRGHVFNDAILLHCAWNPSDPTILATAGTDALARLWTFPHGPSPSSESRLFLLPETPQPEMMQQHVNGNATPPFPPQTSPFVSLISRADDPSDTTVTALSWSPDGQLLALAVYSQQDHSAKLLIFTVDGDQKLEVGALDATITCLRWTPEHHLLLIILGDEQGSSVLFLNQQPDGFISREEIYRTGRGQSIRDAQERQPPQLLDALWVSDRELVVCGEDILRFFKISGDQLVQCNKDVEQGYHGFTRMAYDSRSRLIATGSDGGIVELWDMEGHSLGSSVHQGAVTALEWQPSPHQSLTDEEPESILASAGEEGVICIWTVRGPKKGVKRYKAMDSSVVALAFTPDGAFLTGATRNKILIWKTDNLGFPSACWIRQTDHGWETPKSTSSDTLEQHHCLCWDSTGHRLAYGVANQLAIIDFNR